MHVLICDYTHIFLLYCETQGKHGLFFASLEAGVSLHSLSQKPGVTPLVGLFPAFPKSEGSHAASEWAASVPLLSTVKKKGINLMIISLT